MPRHLTVNDETVVCGPYLGELAGDSYTTDPDDIDCIVIFPEHLTGHFRWTST
ncbi:MAG: hypothetical protein OXE17_01235 [Chloroflexi bacterium]|nr:hypothetical protein [Chloroflexota bacterium]